MIVPSLPAISECLEAHPLAGGSSFHDGVAFKMKLFK